MAQTPFSLLLLRRLSISSKTFKNPKWHSHSLFFISTKPFSTSPLPTPNPTTPPEKPTSLSSRMNFIFEQIDQIEKQKQEKQESDQTLQRIRAWRQSKQPQIITKTQETNSTAHKLQDPEIVIENPERVSGQKQELVRKEVEVVHPWPEWIELMERLVKQNYFDHRRKDEDAMVREMGFSDVVVEDGDDAGVDFSDFKTVQTACLNFGKDRFDILRSLSRQDIQILVGYGCPSADKKVVFSAKLLRKHVHLDEGDVCSSCSLRSSCERAYLVTNKEDEARTIDIMRVLLAYSFDPVNGSVVNKSILKQKSVKTVIRKLLHEIVKLSAVPIDPNLPPPVIKKPPPKVKQPPPPPRKRVGRDDVEMKKGDWLCPKCDFMNFAKNLVCLQCDAKRPKRQLLPGEWECPECNFLNYRRNMACFHCDCKRPPDEFMENQNQERQQSRDTRLQHGPNMRLEKVATRPEVSNAWNFDFDDDESDGADVAAFECADSPVRVEDSPLDIQAYEGNYRGHEDNFSNAGRVPRVDREYSDIGNNRTGTGFDDFDDEDDVDSYEIDTQDNRSARKTASYDLSEVEGFSEAEDIDNNFPARHRAASPSYNKPSKPMRQKAAFSDSEDDGLGFDADKELSVHPKWKSSHVADSRSRSRGRGPTGPSRGLSYGSDEDFSLQSDSDDDSDEDFRSRQTKGSKPVSGRSFQRRARSDSDSFSGSESDADDGWSSRNRPRGRGNNFKGRGDHNFVKDDQFRSNGRTGDRRNSMSDGRDKSSRGSRGDSRGFERDDRSSRGFRSDNRGFQRGDDRSSRGGRGDSRGFQRGDDRSSRGGRGDSRGFQRGDDRSSSRGGRGNNRGFHRDDYGGRGMNDNRGGDSRKFGGPKRERSGKPQHRRSDTDVHGDSGELRNSRRVIER